jgi:phasin family protein
MTKNTNPMFGMDFSKLLSEMKMPMPQMDFEQGIQSLRRNVEAMTAANQLAAEGCQAVLKRQMEIVKTAMQETSAMLNELAAAGTPEDKVARQLELVKQAYESSLINAREMQEMLTKSSEEAMEVISERISGCIDEAKAVAKKTGSRKAA